MSHLLFVYGTLKRGHGNHHIIRNAEYVGDFVTESKFGLVSMGEFPGMVDCKEPSEEGCNIKGELFFVDDAMLEYCDRLEGVPHFYRREAITVRSESDPPDTISCFVYILNKASAEGKEFIGAEWPPKKKETTLQLTIVPSEK